MPSEINIGAPVIEIHGVKKIYKTGSNEVLALRGIDITVRQGELVAIMGSSGSGKSTLMNILGCLDVPTEGAYSLDGIRVEGLSKNQLADIRNQKLGFVFQGFNLLARTTALDNVELPLLYDRSGKKNDTRQIAQRALERVGLADRLDHQPSELSGGQQQRVAIARALANEPPILVADEPTGNLDSRTGRQIFELFARLVAAGTTVLLVTHDPVLAGQVPRRITMSDGRIVGDTQTAGPPADAD